MARPPYCGIGGNAIPKNNTDFQNFLPVMRNWKFRPNWGNYEIGRGTYDTSYLDNAADLLANNGLYYYITMLVAPADPSNWSGSTTPQYLFLSPDNVPLVQDDKGNFYPYYFNAAYGTRRSLMQTNFINEILAYTGAKATYLLGVESAEGNTGDPQPYNGNPLNHAYDITDDQWNTYKQGIWIPENSVLTGAGKYFMINGGNNGANYQWGLDNLPNVWFKPSDQTHFYNIIGELYSSQMFISLRNSPTNANRTGSEHENTLDLAWFKVSSTQNTQYILASCAHCAVDMVHIAPSNALADHSAYIWFNDRAGFRNTSETNMGWCVLRDYLDAADINRFPISTFDPLVASADQAAYNSKYNNILSNHYPYYVEKDQLSSLLATGKSGNTYVNNSRITKILAANPGAVYIGFQRGVSSYNNDVGVYMIPDNYGQFLTQFNPNATSKGVWRVGNVLDFWGRFGRSFDHVNNKNEMLFTLDSGLAGNHSYNVTIKVTYLNSGTNQWSLNYWNGTSKVSEGIVTNTNTNRAVTNTFVLSNCFFGGNLSNSTDITIKNENNTDTVFFAIDVIVNSQNTEGTAGSYKLSNALSSSCSESVITLYTNGSFAVGKTLYSDNILQNIQTGYTYVIDNSSNHIYNLNSSTGVIGSDTGGICGGGTSGTYILGTNSGTVCGNTPTVLYTNGSFSIGKVLYSDINLTQIVTGSTFVVTASDSKIYNLDTSTGIVGSDTGLTCTAGTAGTFKTGNSSSTVCSQGNTTLYTSGIFTIGKVLYTNSVLTIPATGFSFVADTSTNFIYSVNSVTGAVIAQVGICNGGTSNTFQLNNSSSTVCTAGNSTLYTNGTFAVGKILYTDINLINVQTGFLYAELVSTKKIYNINSSTGVVISDTGNSCGNGHAVHGKKKV